MIESTTNHPRELESPDGLLTSPAAEPASASADLPAMLLAARDYIKANKSGRTEIWICSDIRAERLERRERPLAGLRDGFPELTQGVRFHLLAYPADRARQPVGARDRRAPAARPATRPSCWFRCSMRREGGRMNGNRSPFTSRSTGPGPS